MPALAPSSVFAAVADAAGSGTPWLAAGLILMALVILVIVVVLLVVFTVIRRILRARRRRRRIRASRLP